MRLWIYLSCWVLFLQLSVIHHAYCYNDWIFVLLISTYTKSFARSGTWNTTFCVSWSHDTVMFFTQGIDDWTALELYPDGSYQIFVAADAPKPNPSWYLWCFVQIVFDFEIGIMKRRCAWCRMLSPMYLAPMQGSSYYGPTYWCYF